MDAKYTLTTYDIYGRRRQVVDFRTLRGLRKNARYILKTVPSVAYAELEGPRTYEIARRVYNMKRNTERIQFEEA